MLGDSLPSHGQPSAEFAERLTIFRMQPIEQMPAVRVGQSSKDSIIIHPRDMQPFGSLSRYYAIERLRVKPCRGKKLGCRERSVLDRLQRGSVVELHLDHPGVVPEPAERMVVSRAHAVRQT